MREIIDMNPFFGVQYRDENGTIRGGDTLSNEDSERLQEYFDRYKGKGFHHSRSLELAHYALNNLPVPNDFNPVIPR